MKKIIALIVITFGFHFVFAQTWTGPTSVVTGQVGNYTFNNGIFYTSYSWSAVNGTVSSPSFNGMTYSCTVTWQTAGKRPFNIHADGAQRGTLSLFLRWTGRSTRKATFTHPNGTKGYAIRTITQFRVS